MFPVTEGFVLSKLLFSPDASFSSRNLLISKEVRSSNDYAKCIRPFRDLKWSNALLKFVIFDTDSTPRMWPFGEYTMEIIEFLPTMPQTTLQWRHLELPPVQLILHYSLRPLFMPWRLTRLPLMQLLRSNPSFRCSKSPRCRQFPPAAQLRKVKQRSRPCWTTSKLA